MMTNTERELRRLIAEAGYKAVTVTMKCNGDQVVITPCFNGLTVSSFEDIEYYLIDSPSVNFAGKDTLDGVAHVLLDYAKAVKETDDDIEHLKAYIRSHGHKSDWDFVSDYHKDLFGHRPHVGADRLIAWANSDSKDSARHYVTNLPYARPTMSYEEAKEWFY